MFGARVIARHAHLVHEMAKSQGVDIGKAMIRGDLTADELRLSVERCTGCSAPGSCAHWLEDHDGGSKPPSYCENSVLMERLSKADAAAD